MLRRKPTAITITSEDITAFEDLLSKNALPFQQTVSAAQQHPQSSSLRGNQQSATATVAAGPEYIDPNDELKPLPGERAKIVRTREDRILGR